MTDITTKVTCRPTFHPGGTTCPRSPAGRILMPFLDSQLRFLYVQGCPHESGQCLSSKKYMEKLSEPDICEDKSVEELRRGPGGDSGFMNLNMGGITWLARPGYEKLTLSGNRIFFCLGFLNPTCGMVFRTRFRTFDTKMRSVQKIRGPGLCNQLD